MLKLSGQMPAYFEPSYMSHLFRLLGCHGLTLAKHASGVTAADTLVTAGSSSFQLNGLDACTSPSKVTCEHHISCFGLQELHGISLINNSNIPERTLTGA